MRFSEFSNTLEKIEATTLRNEITKLLAELFGQLEPKEIEPACWLLLGRIVPPYEGIEFQFADRMLMRSLSEVSGKSTDDILSVYKKLGDLAEAAQTVVNAKSETTMSVVQVFEELKALAMESGEGSQEKKIWRVVTLLQQLDTRSVRFVIRIIQTKLRLGFSDMTMLDALSWAVKGDKSDRKILEDAYQNKHDIGKLAAAYLTHHEQGLAHFEIELGIPIQPALCQRLKSADEMIEKMGKVYVEPKYDGTRVQIHVHHTGSWRVRTFTRSLEESSAQFPELQDCIAQFKESDVILDCEAVGYDAATGKLLPFQETIQRKRTHDVDLFSAKIPLRFFVFDILFKDGKSLLPLPLHERKTILANLRLKEPFIISPYIVTESADELRAFHGEQLAHGLEGAVIKQYDGVYQPGRKGFSWVKFKEEEGAEGKLSDTIDAVVMGYWYGKGKRTGFGVGAFLIGVQGPNEQILTLSKVGTGLTDDQWRELKERAKPQEQQEMPTSYVVPKSLIPDVWTAPAIVVEVAGDELTKSPNHTAGLALRFPRLVRFRDDKNVEQLTTTKELETIK